jgi:hypothetical protein
MLMASSESTFEILDAISRTRSLNDAEVLRLQWAIDKDVRKNGRRNERWYWTNGDDRRLCAYLKRGKKPAQIACLMGRTERAVWRRIYRIGLGVRKAKGSIANGAGK